MMLNFGSNATVGVSAERVRCRTPGAKPARGARIVSGIARRSLSEPYGAGVGVPDGTPWAPTCKGRCTSLLRTEFLDGHASDTLEEAAASAVEAWKKGSRDRAGSGVCARELAAMRRFLSDAYPSQNSPTDSSDEALFLHRALLFLTPKLFRSHLLEQGIRAPGENFFRISGRFFPFSDAAAYVTP